MRLYRYVGEKSSGWMTVSGYDETPPEAPWRPVTTREYLRWWVTSDRFSLVDAFIMTIATCVVIWLTS